MDTTGHESDDLEHGAANEEQQDPSEEAAPEAEDVAADTAARDESDASDADVIVPVRPRSAPRYGAFIGAGVIIGVVLALILYFVLPSDGSTSSMTGLIYLIVLTTPFTALLGGLAAVLFEKKTLRK